MHHSLTRRRPARLVTALAAFAMLGSLLVVHSTAHADPPPNPSDQQIQGAKSQKDQLAGVVGQLSAQVAQLQTQLNRLEARKELAEQKVALALSQLQQAMAQAVKAQQDVAAAQTQVDKAQHQFVAYMQASYENGDLGGTTGNLLTASDPNILLEQGTLDEYQSSHQLDAIGTLQRAKVGKSNADAAARKAVLDQKTATDNAVSAQKAAVAAVAAAKSQESLLQATLSQNQQKLQDAQVQLATLNNQRSKFLAWQRQKAIDDARRAAEARARAAAAAAAALAAQQQQQNNGGGGGGGPVGTSVPPGPIGNWTAHAGQIAVQRAEQWLGTPYSWAGGNANGPTYGVCAGDGAFNDCHIVGFDCSGLAMYAWAQYPFAHYAATQYLQGSVHPDVASLMPGDLVFWSSDGTVAGIHHVAIYIGQGNVIQAPESGALIQITPLDQVAWGYFGATRPLT